MERLQKRIASSGLCSRRAAERLIEEGRVKVNGKRVIQHGVQVSEEDVIEVKGRVLRFGEEKITIALNKPVDTVSTRKDPFGAQTVMDLLPKNLQHLNPVGRLDKNSEGLLLLTSDGDLLLRLTHPRYEHSKTYEVGVEGQVKETVLKKLNKGLDLDGTWLQAMKSQILRQEEQRTWLEMVLKEGRKRQIRRVMEALGHPVFSLKRTAIGKLELGHLKKGSYRVLTEKELKAVLDK